MASEIKCSVKRNVETLMSRFIHTHTLSRSLSFFWPSRARWELAGCEPDGRSEQEFAFFILLSLSSDEDFVTQIFRHAEEGAPTAKLLLQSQVTFLASVSQRSFS
jgi:hypothetical protein